MIYLILGENSYETQRKISQLKESFLRKNKSNFLIDAINEGDENLEKISEILGASSLFSKTRLVILKNTLAFNPEVAKFLKENANMLKSSPNIFVFWEKSLEGEEEKSFFKKYAEKIQEVKPRSEKDLDLWLQSKSKLLGLNLGFQERAMLINKAKDGGERAIELELEKLALSWGAGNAGSENSLTPSRTKSGSYSATARPHLEFSSPAFPAPDKSVFYHADKIFGKHPILGLKESADSGFDSQNILNVLMWKLKNIFLVKRGESKSLNPYVAKKTAPEAAMFSEEKILNTFWEGIKTDSELKRDGKNANEHLERFILGALKP